MTTVNRSCGTDWRMTLPVCAGSRFQWEEMQNERRLRLRKKPNTLTVSENQKKTSKLAAVLFFLFCLILVHNGKTEQIHKKNNLVENCREGKGLIAPSSTISLLDYFMLGHCEQFSPSPALAGSSHPTREVKSLPVNGWLRKTRRASWRHAQRCYLAQVMCRATAATVVSFRNGTFFFFFSLYTCLLLLYYFFPLSKVIVYDRSMTAGHQYSFLSSSFFYLALILPLFILILTIFEHKRSSDYQMKKICQPSNPLIPTVLTD